MEKGVITVVGQDQIGIIGKVCSFLADHQINILDISQTIIDEYFNMMMIVDVTSKGDELGDIASDIAKLGKEIGVDIKLQHENIFRKMHRL